MFDGKCSRAWTKREANARNAVGVRVNDELCETTKSEHS